MSRWLILLLAWGTFLISFVDRLLWGSASVAASAAMGLTLTQSGALVSAFYGGYVIANLIAGVAVDRAGPRLMLSLSMLSLGALTFLFSLNRAFLPALLLQALMGVAAGADYAACIKLLAAWFPRQQRGRAIGLFMTASSIGLATAALLLTYLNWQAAYQAAGLVTILLGLLCLLLPRALPAQEAGAPQTPAPLTALMRDRNIVLLTIANFGALWGTWGFAFWAQSLMVKGYAIAPREAASIMTLAAAGAIAGKPVIGLLSDRAGSARRLPAIFVLAAFAAMLLLFGALSTPGAFWIAAPFLGLAAFGYSPLLNTMAAELGGVYGAAGTVAGVTNGIGLTGNIMVPLAVTYVFTATGSFAAAFATLAAGPALAVLAMLGISETA